MKYLELVTGLHRENQAIKSSRSRMANRWMGDRFGIRQYL